MYQNYFGFKERPFQLVPNPAYLFLSRSHEEAMAHLAYAVSEGDGFITIIGEVGTGKTTLCRAFIESLDDRCEVAYIFNPKLTAVELLEAVCDEFGIHAPVDTNAKDLIDALNRFLLEKKAAGRQAMLIVDEAQDLSREVLEQIRLLSNLETNSEKLLQIVLAGQPELDDLLESYKLRQLSQRITLSCRLTPLTYRETDRYIQHRIRIAARNQGVAFTQPALRKIHAYSGGIPRLIHIVCDRALLTAFVMNREKISGPIVDSAIRELSPREDIGRLRTAEKRKTALLAVLFCLMVVMLFVVKPKDSGTTSQAGSTKTFKIPAAPQEKNQPVPSADIRTETPAASEPAAGQMPEKLPGSADASISQPMPAPPVPEPAAVVPPTHLMEFLAGIDNAESKKTALAAALALWGTSLPIREYTDKELIDPETYFNLTARENGFLVHRTRRSRSEISKLNLPVIFEFALPDVTEPYYLTLSRMDDEGLSFQADTTGKLTLFSSGDVDSLWTGTVYIPWINFFDYEGITPIGGGEQGVRALKQLLEKIGYDHLPPGPEYDSETDAAVKEIQISYGLPVDGLVGPLTKMAIYNELPGLGIPHIRGNEAAPGKTETAN